MRVAIVVALVISNVLAGLACACQTNTPAAPQHAMHGDHGDVHGHSGPAVDVTGGDCCDDCDRHASTAVAEPLPAVLDLRLVREDWDVHRDDVPVAIDVSLEEDDPPGTSPPNRNDFLPDRNPVVLSDRMLE